MGGDVRNKKKKKKKRDFREGSATLQGYKVEEVSVVEKRTSPSQVGAFFPLLRDDQPPST